MTIRFLNTFFTNKPICSQLLTALKSQKHSIISPANNTRKAGSSFLIKHKFSLTSTNRVGHEYFDRDHEIVSKRSYNEFSRYTEIYNETHQNASDLKLRGDRDPEKDLNSNDTKTSDNNFSAENSGMLFISAPQSSQIQRTLPSSKLDDSMSHVDSLLVLQRQLYEYPEVRRAFALVQKTLLPILLQKLSRARAVDNVTVKLGLEIAASIDLLKLFGESSPELDKIGRRALEGARLLEKGLEDVRKGKTMLEVALLEIPNHVEQKINSC